MKPPSRGDAAEEVVEESKPKTRGRRKSKVSEDAIEVPDLDSESSESEEED